VPVLHARDADASFSFAKDRNALLALPGATDTGIGTTTQATVFYRFFQIYARSRSALRGIIARQHRFVVRL
jgi:hypothetical protein